MTSVVAVVADLQLWRICNSTPLNMSICDAEKVRTAFLGLQILILNGAGLQILLNPPCAKRTQQIQLNYPAQLLNVRFSCVGFAIRHN